MARAAGSKTLVHDTKPTRSAVPGTDVFAALIAEGYRIKADSSGTPAPASNATAPATQTAAPTVKPLPPTDTRTLPNGQTLKLVSLRNAGGAVIYSAVVSFTGDTAPDGFADIGGGLAVYQGTPSSPAFDVDSARLRSRLAVVLNTETVTLEEEEAAIRAEMERRRKAIEAAEQAAIEALRAKRAPKVEPSAPPADTVNVD